MEEIDNSNSTDLNSENTTWKLLIDGPELFMYEFELKMEGIKAFQEAVIPHIKNKIELLKNDLETKRDKSNENVFADLDPILINDHCMQKDSTNDFYLLATVGINSAIEALLKKLVKKTGKINNGENINKWNITKLEDFYKTIDVSISENKHINYIRKISNIYKHNEGLCDSYLEQNGFGKKDEQIQITEQCLISFQEKSLEFAFDIIDKTYKTIISTYKR